MSLQKFLRPVLIFALAIFTLSACQEFTKRDTSKLYAPDAVIGGQTDDDALTIAYRLSAAGEHELALKSYYRAAADQGFDSEILTALGSTNLHLGRLNQAERQLRRATEIDARHAPAWNNLGVVLMETNRHNEAARAFEVAYSLTNASDTRIRENLQRALAIESNPIYDQKEKPKFNLIRRGNGDYRLRPST